MTSRTVSKRDGWQRKMMAALRSTIQKKLITLSVLDVIRECSCRRIIEKRRIGNEDLRFDLMYVSYPIVERAYIGCKCQNREEYKYILKEEGREYTSNNGN